MIVHCQLETPDLLIRLATDPAGRVDAAAPVHPFLVFHVGRSVQIECDRDGRVHRGVAVHGDLDIVPAGIPSRWYLRDQDTALIVRVSNSLLDRIAEKSGTTNRSVELSNRFQVRDAQIEQIGWALQAAAESGNPGGQLYLESLSTSLAAALIERHSSAAKPVSGTLRGLTGRQLRQVLSYIEDNLAEDLSISAIAAVAGLGVSQFKSAFRTAVGAPVHQYVIGRRVDRARRLLKEGHPVNEVSAATGFAHQSHLAYHVRRAFGVSPARLRSAPR